MTTLLAWCQWEDYYYTEDSQGSIDLISINSMNWTDSQLDHFIDILCT